MILRLCLILLLAGLPASFAQAFETSARSALVLDYDTGTILLSKNADEALPPASMSKLMTLNMVFEALEDGRISLDDTFLVSEKAATKGGSKMFVREGSRVRVEDLIRGVIIQSGNDACIVLAEGLAGTEEEFARRMTERAHELGMINSQFANSTGWPDDNHLMSAEDLVFLAVRIIERFPQYYGYFSETSFTWDDITQDNRNPLLSLDIGADGLKTGHTEDAGYGLVGSAVQDGRRIVFMFGGLTSASARANEAERITRWAFRDFAMKTLFERGKIIDTADVWLGAEDEVALSLRDDVELLIPIEIASDIRAEYSFTNPIQAPIRAGEEVGTLTVTIPNQDPLTYPLIAASSVESGGFMDRLSAATDIVLRRIRSYTSGG